MVVMPPCGCRRGCMHRDEPQFPAQRQCRAGVEPDPQPEPAHEVVYPSCSATIRARMADAPAQAGYACGTCGVGGLVAHAVGGGPFDHLALWRITCSNGHELAPTPGAEIHVRGDA